MKRQIRTPEETYAPAIQRAQGALSSLNPSHASSRAGVQYRAADERSGYFELPFFGTLYHVSWPSGTAARSDGQGEPDISSRILMLHYLLTADGTPLKDDWIAFRNLPGGLGYDAAFQGRACQRLARGFGTDAASFESAARVLGGERLSYGDSSFMFRAFPRLRMAAVIHMADDEFPAAANVLFDASSGHYLPTEDLAVLGGLLAGRLLKTATSG